MSINTQAKRSTLELFLISLPAILVIFILKYVPLYGLILPFKDYDYSLGILQSDWAGLSNFRYLFSESAFRITRNTLLMNFLFITVGTTCSVVLALMLYEIGRGYVKLYQTIFFFPYFISWVVAAYIVLSLLDMNHGFLNQVTGVFGAEPVAWYNEPAYWPGILLVAYVWKNIGYGTVIYYTALMSIDHVLFEVAQIDGASRLQRIRYISIPLLKPILILLLLLQIGKIFYSDFGLFYNVTLDSKILYPVTDVIDTYVYRSLTQVGDIGMASAAGFYQSMVGFMLVLATNALVRRLDPDNALF